MGETTNISWCDSTLNVWLGCTKVSNGPQGACEGCYAEVLVSQRFGRAAWGSHADRVETKGWRVQLRKISRMALAAGRPWFVFVNSLSDFWDNQAAPALRREAMEAFRAHPHVTFLLLTKRPQNIVKLFADTLPPTADKRDEALREAFPRNCAILCTVVTQTEFDRDVRVLMQAKRILQPAFAGLSMEPLMGSVSADPWLRDLCPNCHHPECVPSLRSDSAEVFSQCGAFVMETPGPAIDWIITGGETDQGGHKARPSHPDWFRSLREQCAAAGVAFHHKQNGEWAEEGVCYPIAEGARDMPAGTVERVNETFALGGVGNGRASIGLVKIGKKNAGRELDGVVHDARPGVG